MMVNLSPRQAQIMKFASLAYSDGEIAEKLGMNKRVVSTHLSRVKRKLNARNRVDIVLKYNELTSMSTGKSN